MKRNTIQRQAILDAINSLANHPTAEDVYVQVIKTHPTISKATVYRNLAAAAENGEIGTVGIFDGAMHFDHKKEEHFHFFCDKCRGFIDIPSFDLKANLTPFNKLDIKKIELTLRGLCEDCK
ncbi:MAG: transcriptional repressor [Defluviitaleaceae bacterium]|nr:transcriptional repressor [Defluviitaleaceae bacterium]